MKRAVTISNGLIPVRGRPHPAPQVVGQTPRHPLRSAGVALVVLAAFATVGVQLVRLAAKREDGVQVSISAPIATGLSRPDLVDRQGRLLASDVELPSLYVDPQLVRDRDETVEELRTVLPDLDDTALRETLADRSRRFEWIKRGVSPTVAQRVYYLGLPGVSYLTELKRAYPAGRLAGHVLGGVNVDNRAVGGIEQHLDAQNLVDQVVGAQPTSRPAVMLSLDMSVQHAVEDELADAIKTYRANLAAGVVLDVTTGEVIAAASLPRVDPAHPAAAPRAQEIDRISAGTYELGSIFKLITIAQALESGTATRDTRIDVSQPLKVGRFEIKDHHGGGGSLSVRDVFIKSSNVGVGQLALKAGPVKQREFLAALGLTERGQTEAGPIAAPILPRAWGDVEAATIAFGHGIAVSPLQFTAAAASLLNGGRLITPTFLKQSARADVAGRQVVSEKTSRQLTEMMRANVEEPGGTGRRAAVAGYPIGGKTGPAEIAVRGRYDRNAVIASFLAAFPIAKPRYVTLVMIFRPSRTAASSQEITASHTAAPVTRHIVERIAPLLGLKPNLVAAGR
ncbi:MAG: penicillin-binding protein 2 [Caldilineaceae bacterium]|nr:penicillin-binding protein 2 [Caldilineaceae bacterium]